MLQLVFFIPAAATRDHMPPLVRYLVPLLRQIQAANTDS